MSSVGDFVSEVWKWLYAWWQNFKTQVISSARTTDKGISFRFPKQDIVAEGYRVEKGLKIARNIDPANTWKAQQQTQFRKSINNNLRHVAGNLGLLFEIEVILYLTGQGLQLDGLSSEELHSNRDLQLKNIRRYLSQFPFDQMVKYVQTHAAELGKGILEKSKRTLKCRPTTVHYMPQFATEDDLTISCGEDQNANWSLKYVSEPLIRVRDYSVSSAYDIMGGNLRDLIGLDDEIAANPRSAFDIILDKFWNQLESTGWSDDPANFAKLLSFLLRGSEKANFAVHNYTTNAGHIGASPALAKDFIVSGNSALHPKPGAVVSMIRTVDYIKLQYKVPGGAGTYILLRIRVKENGTTMQFYVNNLTSG